jgi:hypothetical protein
LLLCFSLKAATMWTRRRIQVFAFAFIAVMGASFLVTRLTAVNGIDRFGNPLFPDFAQIYVAGQHLLRNQGDSLYDQEIFVHEESRVLNAGDRANLSLIYPPIIAVAGAPFALVSYPTAAWLHAVLSILVACYLARDMSRYFFGESDDAFVAAILFLAFLPLWRVWMFGQNSVWALAILWGSWRLWCSGDCFTSGLLLSLGLYKPHLFVGAWIWSILWGNRRLRAGLLVGLVVCVAIGMICGGPAIWLRWLDAARHTTGLVERIDWMTSIPQAWKLVGGEKLFGNAWSYGLLLTAIVVWIIVLLRMRWKNESPAFALCFALSGSWILSPRLYVYDWILVWPVLLAAWKHGTPRFRQFTAWGGLLFWIHDFFGTLHIPVLTLFGAAAFVWLLCQGSNAFCVSGSDQGDASERCTDSTNRDQA